MSAAGWEKKNPTEHQIWWAVEKEQGEHKARIFDLEQLHEKTYVRGWVAHVKRDKRKPEIFMNTEIQIYKVCWLVKQADPVCL